MIRPSVVITAALLCGSSVLAAQGNANDPWRKVPPLPTSCFHDEWAFDKTLGDVYAQLGEAQAKQQEINDALVLKFGEMDMQVKMQKMMEYLRKDPQKAQKMMEAQANVSTGMKNDVMSGDDARKEREAEFAQLSASFNSEMDAGAKPFRTRRDEIMKTGRRVLGEGDNWEFATRAAETEFNTLIDKENADYEARCAAYFGANGKMHKWLASYRETVIDPVARATEANDEIRATLMLIMHLAPDIARRRSWRPFASMCGSRGSHSHCAGARCRTSIIVRSARRRTPCRELERGWPEYGEFDWAALNLLRRN